MNWYKIANIDNFQERNIANDKIRYLSEIVSLLNRMSKVVFQSGIVVRKALDKILAEKKLDAYKDVHKILFNASKLALDSPHKVRILCLSAAEILAKKVSSLIKERKEFALGNDDATKKKGLRYEQ